MTWSSTPITMLLDRKVDSWTTSVGITLGTVHVSVVSVKLMPSVELDKQFQRRGNWSYLSVLSLPFPDSISQDISTPFTDATPCRILAKWCLFSYRNPGTWSWPEWPVSGEIINLFRTGSCAPRYLLCCLRAYWQKEEDTEQPVWTFLKYWLQGFNSFLFTCSH